MSNAHCTNQSAHSLFVKDIPDHPIRFALIEPAFVATSYDATGILPSMLKQ
jgi:hypothetical protein